MLTIGLYNILYIYVVQLETIHVCIYICSHNLKCVYVHMRVA